MADWLGKWQDFTTFGPHMHSGPTCTWVKRPEGSRKSLVYKKLDDQFPRSSQVSLSDGCPFSGSNSSGRQLTGPCESTMSRLPYEDNQHSRQGTYWVGYFIVCYFSATLATPVLSCNSPFRVSCVPTWEQQLNLVSSWRPFGLLTSSFVTTGQGDSRSRIYMPWCTFFWSQICAIQHFCNSNTTLEKKNVVF